MGLSIRIGSFALDIYSYTISLKHSTVNIWKSNLCNGSTTIIYNLLFLQITYLAFLVAYSYTILARTLPKPAWPEVFVMVYLLSFTAEKCREVFD